MSISRLTIIVEDTVNRTGTIIINGECIYDCNLSFLGNYPCDICGDDVAVSAVQWDASIPMQEIELCTRGSNIQSDTLDATLYAAAQASFDSRKQEIEAEAAEEAARVAAQEEAYFDALLDDLESDSSVGVGTTA